MTQAYPPRPVSDEADRKRRIYILVAMLVTFVLVGIMTMCLTWFKFGDFTTSFDYTLVKQSIVFLTVIGWGVIYICHRLEETETDTLTGRLIHEYGGYFILLFFLLTSIICLAVVIQGIEPPTTETIHIRDCPAWKCGTLV